LGEPVVDAAPVLATMPVLAAALPSLAEPPSAAPPAGFSVASARSDPEPQLASAKIRNGKAGHKARLSMGYRPKFGACLPGTVSGRRSLCAMPWPRPGEGPTRLHTTIERKASSD